MKFKKLMATLISVSLVLISSCNDFRLDHDDINGDAKQVKSEEKLKQLLARNSYVGRDYTKGGLDDVLESTDNAVPSQNDYSSTNTQVKGVDEGDIVKVDGQYIYKMQSDGFVILKVLADGKLEIASKVVIENYSPQEMYLNGDQLVIIGGTYENRPYLGDLKAGLFCDYFYYHTDVDVRVFDITDRTNISEEQHITVSGNYVTSRRIEDTLYLINYYSAYQYGIYYPEVDRTDADSKSDDAANPTPSTSSSSTAEEPLIVPTITVDGEEEPVSLDDIYYYEDCIGYTYLNLVKVDLNNEEDVVIKSYLSNYAGQIYVSENYIYTALYSYHYDVLPVIGVTNWKQYTNFQRYSLETLLNDITYEVEGYIKDRYSMDEYNGYFRVAVTTYNENKTSNGVYVFDDQAGLVGKVEGLALGELIYSARFVGTKAYIVTFIMTDPLYVIDLSDVTKPTVTSELKKDGVSLYLHNYEDGIHMLGIGYNTSEGRNIGLEVALYNVENQNETVMLDRFITDNSSVYAEVMYNPKALLFMESRNIFGFAAEEYFYDYKDYSSSYTNQGFYVFRINDEEKLDVEVLSNVDTFYYNSYSEYSYEDYVNRYYQYITRAVIIQDYLYTISDKTIGIYTEADLNLVERFSLDLKVA